MKKLIIGLLCAGTAATANAQEKSVLVFGNFGGGTSIQNDHLTPKNVQNSFNITPGIGYQFTDRWTVGIQALYNYSQLGDPPQGGPNPMHGIDKGIGLFARYTIPINSLFFFYTQADGMFVRGRTFDDGGGIPGSLTNTYTLRLTPALGLNIKNGYALNFGIGNLGVSYTRIPSANFSNTSLGYNFSKGFSIGLSKNFVHHVKKAGGASLENGARDK